MISTSVAHLPTKSSRTFFLSERLNISDSVIYKKQQCNGPFWNAFFGMLAVHTHRCRYDCLHLKAKEFVCECVCVRAFPSGSSQDQDGQEGRQGHHREVLHTAGQWLPHQQEGVRGDRHHPQQASAQQDCRVSGLQLLAERVQTSRRDLFTVQVLLVSLVRSFRKCRKKLVNIGRLVSQCLRAVVSQLHYPQRSNSMGFWLARSTHTDAGVSAVWWSTKADCSLLMGCTLWHLSAGTVVLQKHFWWL